MQQGIYQNFISCVCLSLSAHPDRHQFIADLSPINTFIGCQQRKLKFSPFHQLSLPADTHSNSHLFSPLCLCSVCSKSSTKRSFPFQITADPFTDPGPFRYCSVGAESVSDEREEQMHWAALMSCQHYTWRLYLQELHRTGWLSQILTLIKKITVRLAICQCMLKYSM